MSSTTEGLTVALSLTLTHQVSSEPFNQAWLASHGLWALVAHAFKPQPQPQPQPQP